MEIEAQLEGAQFVERPIREAALGFWMVDRGANLRVFNKGRFFFNLLSVSKKDFVSIGKNNKVKRCVVCGSFLKKLRGNYKSCVGKCSDRLKFRSKKRSADVRKIKYQKNRLEFSVSAAAYYKRNRNKVLLWNKTYRAKNRNKFLSCQKRHRIKNVMTMSDSYIKELITQKNPLKVKDIPESLISAQRAVLMAKRKLKQMNN